MVPVFPPVMGTSGMSRTPRTTWRNSGETVKVE